jgi:hypothetical protein
MILLWASLIKDLSYFLNVGFTPDPYRICNDSEKVLLAIAHYLSYLRTVEDRLPGMSRT